MNNVVSTAAPNFRDALRKLRKNWKHWALPAAALSLVAILYAALHAPTWQASQALIVRDEARGDMARQGRFVSAEDRKTAQETLLEVSRSASVLSAALVAVGPADKKPSPKWPTAEEVDQLRSAIELKAPKGLEFGRSEVVHLTIRAPSRERALALNAAVCREMVKSLNALRDQRARSIIAELERSVRLANADLDDATQRLRAIEAEVGVDLAELRVLNDAGAGDGNLRTALNQVKAELRQAQMQLASSQEQRELLTSAQNDPELLLAAPNRLLESQPALRQLKAGLVDAQLNTSKLLGRMSEQHPLVQSAMAAEREVRTNLQAELATALRGVAAEERLNSRLIESLEAQAKDMQTRLDRLASIRADYSNLTAEVRQRTALVEEANRAMADAKAALAASASASLLTPIDGPETGAGPVGPGRLTIAAGGVLASLFLSMGTFCLFTPWGASQRRRWTDRFVGRRLSDQLFGRRASDVAPVGDRRRPQAPLQTPQRRSTDPPPVNPAPQEAAPAVERRAGYQPQDLYR